MWIICLLIPAVWGGTELLKNADFENPHFSSTDWYAMAGTISATSDAYHGHTAAKISKRYHDYGSLNQFVTVKKGHRYFFWAYVKILNYASGTDKETVSAGIAVKERSSGKTHYLGFGSTPYIQTNQWHIIGGDTEITNVDISEARVYIRPSDQSVDFIVDYASLQEVYPLSGFPGDANKRIDSVRKGDLTIRLDDHSVEPSGLTVEVQEMTGLFAFGSAVNAGAFVDPRFKGYQDYFYKNFNWAVIENDLKWTNMEPQRGHIDYNTAMNAIDALLHHGIKVRGHNIFWESNSPAWVNHLSGQALRQAMEKRMNDVVGHYKGKLQHWDVDNEALSGDTLVRHSGDRNLTMWMFREVHKIDPNVKLFLNDHEIVNYNKHTVALEDQAVYYKAAGVPLSGIGIQSHVRHPIDLAAIWARLDEVARAGLPIWITEMTIEGVPEKDKPQMFDDLLRLYFSHHAVQGVLLWGFWSQRMSRPESALCTGSDCTVNDSGRRVSHLVQTEWKTHETHSIMKGQTVRIRGFKGSYVLRVKHHGHTIHEETFYLGYQGTDLKVSLTGSNSSPHVDQILVG
ncbi:endo-1,4-beta-xylanase 1-like isoform X1 [Haliotis rubra]|uniref:endo-1,4-beta-xylanase 1-like isoform X1 n=1 Tax=Haliotis rubra TaxID=36100 RepID=UPI001EE5E3F5|nr:endo-1,4-beta-xylanase 1-like isoform X1 [Haliotis rubra]